jgi:hypothetical protein
MATAPLASIPFEEEDFLEEFFRLDDPQKEKELFYARNDLDRKYRKKGRIARRLDDYLWKPLDTWMKNRLGTKSPHQDPWLVRFRAWEQHLNAYTTIKAATATQSSDTSEVVPRTRVPQTPSTPPGVDHIDKMNGILTILDTKIGMLLAANAFVVSGIGLLINGAPKLTDWISGHYTRYVLGLVFNSLLFGVVFLCLFNLWFLLRGFRRVVWGNLEAATATEGDLARIYVGFLIMSAARRTNMFRIVTYVTRYAFALLVLFAIGAASVLLVRGANGFKEGLEKKNSGVPVKSSEGTSLGGTAGSSSAQPTSVFPVAGPTTTNVYVISTPTTKRSQNVGSRGDVIRRNGNKQPTSKCPCVKP